MLPLCPCWGPCWSPERFLLGIPWCPGLLPQPCSLPWLLRGGDLSASVPTQPDTEKLHGGPWLRGHLVCLERGPSQRWGSPVWGCSPWGYKAHLLRPQGPRMRAGEADVCRVHMPAAVWAVGGGVCSRCLSARRVPVYVCASESARNECFCVSLGVSLGDLCVSVCVSVTLVCVSVARAVCLCESVSMSW